jgi:hypothetical protein
LKRLKRTVVSDSGSGTDDDVPSDDSKANIDVQEVKVTANKKFFDKEDGLDEDDDTFESGDNSKKDFGKSSVKQAKRGGKSGDSLTDKIKKLKKLIVQCGVRKLWYAFHASNCFQNVRSKELAGLDDAASVRKLTQILKELGMNGMYTLKFKLGY